MANPESIPFNKPFLTGREVDYIRQAVESGKISGDGLFTRKCHQFFTERFGFHKALLTTSCTDALEMAAILLDIREGDEVIAPSYTFVSTVNAFILRGARIVFADSAEDTPNLDHQQVEALITPRTKAIIPVHYAGMACEMDSLMALSQRYPLHIVEDAAQAIDSYYKGRPLGGIGTFGAFSFHETKNVISGEGGMLAVNKPEFDARAEIIREKGTNRSAFFRGEVDKYGWVDMGSSFLPSEIIAAFLYAQLENLAQIQQKRKALWERYFECFEPLEKAGKLQRPRIPDYATNNAHMFYLVCNSLDERSGLIAHLKSRGIMAVFHYLSLHSSKFYAEKHDGRALPRADYYTDRLLRLPLYYELDAASQERVIDAVLSFYGV
ncbi:MAG: dTDP-4-amino-4,6-dideoxygalactose transaminase [Bacteroidia bacterium]|jgi:dTDP-4-amino-4,6-dideoxygalactose transaminase|nr:dTDP-4-amino-4,6-dideoxygalactose transaminase [Bacteroidia bacterium]MCC6768105.1 dTDP-4-amino-4,6-dideoxygalactose transaminase [Bacteroidia bacterium]